MRAKGIIQAIIGAGGFVLVDITVNTEMNEIKLAIPPMKREQYWCGICHRKVMWYDKSRVRQQWCCLDVGTQKVHVEAEQPRVRYPKHGVVTATVPWAQHGQSVHQKF